jgi:hypothetical protein
MRFLIAHLLEANYLLSSMIGYHSLTLPPNELIFLSSPISLMPSGSRNSWNHLRSRWQLFKQLRHLLTNLRYCFFVRVS